MSANGSAASGQVRQALDDFRRSLKSGFVEESLAKQLASIAGKAQANLEKGQLREADGLLATSLLTIKRHLGSEISLRQGFVLSSILVEDARRHIADPAVLFADAADFATAFFELYSHHRYRRSGIPDYLMKRPFPKGYKDAAAAILRVVDGFELPGEQRSILANDIRALVRQAPAFAKGKASAEALYIQQGLSTTLCFHLLEMQGVFLTEYQVGTVLGMFLFAVPAWLCLCPAAWLVQAIVLAIGLVAYGIYSLMKTPAAQKAYKNIWEYIYDCDNSIKASKDKLTEETKDLSDDEKKDVKDALEKTLKEVENEKIAFTGKKGDVVAKLRALIALL